MARFFSEREIRAVAVFLPLAGLLVAVLFLARPRADSAAARIAEAEMELRRDSIVRFHFDPNTVGYDDLLKLGFTKYEAVSLLKYRTSGKIFRIPEDVALCYGISDSMFREIRPWIRIGRKYAIAPREYRTGRRIAEPLPPRPGARFALREAAASRSPSSSIQPAREGSPEAALLGEADLSLAPS